MPYICTDSNRYLGEHSCGHYHYGDQTLVRLCCVDDAKAAQMLAMRVAFTSSHPAAQLARAAQDALTEAELVMVGRMVAVYDHGPAGFRIDPYHPNGNGA